MFKKILIVIGCYAIIDFAADRLEKAVSFAYRKGFEAGFECKENGLTLEEAKREFWS